MQNCSNSIANALKLLQSCTKPSLWPLRIENPHSAMAQTLNQDFNNYNP